MPNIIGELMLAVAMGMVIGGVAAVTVFIFRTIGRAVWNHFTD